MKKTVRIIGGFLLVFVFFGVLLDDRYNVSRDITISASKSEIHNYVNDLKKWPVWAPWQENDPTIVTTYGDITSGIGAHQTWTSKDGPGWLTITESSLDDGIAYNIYFEKHDDDHKALVKMIYSQKDSNNPNEITVSWTMEGAVNMPIIGPYFRMFLEYMIADMYDQGLARLKETVENK